MSMREVHSYPQLAHWLGKFLDEVRQAVWSMNPKSSSRRRSPSGLFYKRSMAALRYAHHAPVGGSMALLLGVVAYGVIAYSVSQRTAKSAFAWPRRTAPTLTACSSATTLAHRHR